MYSKALKKRSLIFVAIISLFSLLYSSGQTTSVKAEGLDKTQVAITDFAITKNGNPVSSIAHDETFALKMSWDASVYGKTLHEGDYFIAKLPDKMVFPSNSASRFFDILAPDGVSVVAKAEITPGAVDGGTVKVTFTNYVENRENIKGTMMMDATFNRTAINTNTTNKFEVAIGGVVKEVGVHITGPIGLPDTEVIGKYSSSAVSEQEAMWYVRINFSKTAQTDVVIHDALKTDSGDLLGMYHLPGTFTLHEVVFNQYGETISDISSKDVSDQITFSADKSEFTYHMGDLPAGKQWRLDYRTTYVPGVKLKNKVDYTSKEATSSKESKFLSSSSSGTGSGDLNSKIKIFKIDESDPAIKLAGATFRLTNLADNKTFEVTTDAKGEATSPTLVPGTYRVEEIKAPNGYELNTTAKTITVTADAPAHISFTNKKEVLRGKIEITKQDKDTKAVLKDAEFDVKDKDGKVVDHVVTNDKGVATTKELPIGEYTFVETKAPKGYNLDATPIAVKLGKHNETVQIKLDNVKSVGKIIVSKFDKASNARLSGMVFKIRNVETGLEKIIDMEKNNVMEIYNLPLGTYEITEVKAPNGYELDSTVHTLVLEKDGDVKELNMYDLRKPETPQPPVTKEQKGASSLPATGTEHQVEGVNFFVVIVLTAVLFLGFLIYGKKKSVVK